MHFPSLKQLFAKPSTSASEPEKKGNQPPEINQEPPQPSNQQQPATPVEKQDPPPSQPPRPTRTPSPRRRASEDCHYLCGCKNDACGRSVEAPGDLCEVCVAHAC
ncbi:hypothetical protein QBC33DRAFT_556552 [Phialemonium atrogriseum]|uniref:Uncharacterized protein n=1 Tax=Phialemonium atrogriseum TaxID=1093897 RepID=A0AAJ0FRG8_9PEZI|nr:uncharacterized protein QBC33DRAFT_556552 [Phialemonium atrogriseum]KAK1770130.1 hypothetical protein QBC33DRAFT_556552 [Phialemonium atrogriseum]